MCLLKQKFRQEIFLVYGVQMVLTFHFNSTSDSVWQIAFFTHVLSKYDCINAGLI